MEELPHCAGITPRDAYCNWGCAIDNDSFNIERMAELRLAAKAKLLPIAIPGTAPGPRPLGANAVRAKRRSLLSRATLQVEPRQPECRRRLPIGRKSPQTPDLRLTAGGYRDR